MDFDDPAPSASIGSLEEEALPRKPVVNSARFNTKTGQDEMLRIGDVIYLTRSVVDLNGVTILKIGTEGCSNTTLKCEVYLGKPTFKARYCLFRVEPYYKYPKV